MKRFKNILLVFDPESSDRSTFRRATALAKKNQARLTVISVVDELPHDLRMLVAEISTQELLELATKELLLQAKSFIKLIEREVDDIEFKVLTGTPIIEIIRQVLRNKHDLVMVTAEGESGIKDRLFGSTSMRLMRKCPCPVWVMKQARYRRYFRIMAAVDPGSANMSQERISLNRVIMDLAISMAALEESELHIVHAWRLFAEGHIRGFGGVSPGEIEQWRESTRDDHRKQLDDLLQYYSLEGLNSQVHLPEGSPDSLIPELARKKRIDLIVMGTVCRTGISGFFIGNTAENVLQQVKCSVLTVKPKAFVSPVTLDESGKR